MYQDERDLGNFDRDEALFCARQNDLTDFTREQLIDLLGCITNNDPTIIIPPVTDNYNTDLWNVIVIIEEELEAAEINGY